VRQAAADAGVRPEDYQPTAGDAQFRATYQKMTGKDFQPGDFAKADLERDLAQAPPQARAVVVQSHEYDTLGTPRARELADRAQQIENGEWTPPGAPVNLAPDARQLVANQWLANQPGAAEVQQLRQLKAAYRQTHPEFGQFKDWQAQMFNLQAVYGADGFALYRQQVAASNPSFAAYLDTVTKSIKRANPGITPQDLRARLDGATIGIGAWFAATGQAQSVYDSPRPTNGPDPATMAQYGAYSQQDQQNVYNPNAPVDWASVLQQYA
jgi:hypothetical protein